MRALPDHLLMQALDHFDGQDRLTQKEASDLVRAGLKSMLIRAHREERDRRLEKTA